MIRLVVVLISALGLTLAAISRWMGNQPRADLVYVNPSGVHTLDPARMSWTQDFRLALNLWEGLTTWNPRTLAAQPAAADLPEISDDGLVYTFTVRADSHWSNGDPVTSADFVRGWRRAFEPGTAADYAFFFTNHIAGVHEYVAWRNSNVAAISALRKLERGVTPSTSEWNALRHEWTDSSAVHGGIPGKFALLAEVSPDQVAALKERARAALIHHLARHAAEMQARVRDIGIEALDQRTIRVRLVEPCPYFLDLTSTPAFLPAHESIDLLRLGDGEPRITSEGLVVYDPQWTKPNYGASGYNGLVTNGPYRLARWAFRQGVRLEVNPFYRRAREMQCRSVEMLEYSNVTASLMAYERGDVDFLTDMTVPYAHELARQAHDGTRPDFKPATVLATYFLNFNCSTPGLDGTPNPFVDARVRRAFTLATDRATLVDRALSRGDRAAFSIVPPDAIPSYSPPAGLPFNIQSARQLLDEAGYADRTTFPAVPVLCTFNDERLVQALARMWNEALGVRVELRVQESKTLASDKAAGQFMIARGNWYADYADATTFLNCHLTGDGNNDAGYSNAQFDAVMSRARQAGTSVERARLLAEAEAILVQRDCPILPILHYTQLLAIKPHVRGLHPNARLWFPFQYVTFER